MTSTAKKILEDALSLPEDERESLAKALLTSLRRTPEDIERAWAEEAMQRLEREARGKSKAVPWDEAKRQLKATHGFD